MRAVLAAAVALFSMAAAAPLRVPLNKMKPLSQIYREQGLAVTSEFRKYQDSPSIVISDYQNGKLPLQPHTSLIHLAGRV